MHLAAHGIAEPLGGQSLSMVVLADPQPNTTGEDGLLRLGEIYRRRGTLDGAEMVVLSACRTAVGPQARDDGPEALPLGFLVAGASSVISTLWSIDDRSTALLMGDFYERLLAGETDRLAAFTAARRALREAYPDPFHWAAFRYMGAPGSRD